MDPVTPHPICSTLYQCLYDWQTLIAGCVAIGAAWIGGRYINKQVIQAERHEKERRDNRASAARAVLPLSLSAFCDYAKESSVTLLAVRHEVLNADVFEETTFPAIPTVPENAISNLQACIETITPSIARILSQLIAKTQIQNSRMRGACDRLSLKSTEIAMIDSAIIYARASSLFAYARQETDEAPQAISWDDVIEACRPLSLHYDSDYLLNTINEWKKIGGQVE